MDKHDDKSPTYDWERPNSPNYMFNQGERDIIVKCINILTSDYHFDENEFISLTGTDDKMRFIEIADKLRNNEDLNEADGWGIEQAVMHVSMFPMAHIDEVKKQFDVKMYQLFWFSSRVREIFADVSEEQSVHNSSEESTVSGT